MKRLYVMFAAMFLVAAVSTLLTEQVARAATQDKVVERSHKKTASWIGAVGDGYFVVTVTGLTLEDAKANCLTQLKTQILGSVAQNIKATSSTNISQTTENNSIASFVESFSSSLETKGATIPFLDGISLSKVEDYYWEKHENKASGKIFFSYSIKYPFTAAQLKSLVYKFREQDQDMEGQLVAAERVLSSTEQASSSSSLIEQGVLSTEEIQRTLGVLDMLDRYFFDEVRSSRTRVAINGYRGLYKNLKLVKMGESRGQIQVGLKLGDRLIVTSQKPSVKSNCATQISNVNAGSLLMISYDVQGCVEQEENYIEVLYRFGGYAVKERFYFNL